MLQKLAGFAREQMIAVKLGATPVADAFLMGTVWSDMLGLMLTTALPAALVPAYVATIQGQGLSAANHLTRRLFLRLCLVGGLFVAVAQVTIPYWLRPLIAAWPPDLIRLAEGAAWWSLLQVPLFGVAGLLRSALNARDEYIYSPLGTTAQNVVNALLAFWFAQVPLQLVKLQLIGFAMPGLVALIPLVWLYRSQPVPAVEVTRKKKSPPLTSVLPFIIWSTLGFAYLPIERFFSAVLPGGSTAALTFADRLRQFALQTVVLSIVTVGYPALAEASARTDWARFRALLDRGIRYVFLLALPAAAGLTALRELLVQALFQWGVFDQQGTVMTASVLSGYAAGIPLLAINALLAHAIFALGRPWIPVLGLAAGVLTQAAISAAFVGGRGGWVLSWAGAAAALVPLLIQLWALGATLEIRLLEQVGHWARENWQPALASMVMGVLCWGLAGFVPSFAERTLQVISTVVICGFGVGVYVAGLWYFGVPEVSTGLKRLLRRS
ncbi:MAG: murein biosynthesis integral membrane protein MurJ [Bacillota bacterium]